MANTYVEIAEDFCVQLRDAKKNRIPDPGANADWTEHHRLEKDVLRAAMKTIVFAAMAVEAAIFDLAAIHLSDEYALKYLDKIDLFGKWAIVPKLICGKSLDLNAPAMNGLSSLIKDRNALVHYKSSPMPKNTREAYERLQREGAALFEQFLRNAENAMQTIVLLSLEVDRTLGTPTSVLGYYGKRGKVVSDPASHVALKDLIDNCRQIDAKNAKKMKTASKPSTEGTPAGD